MVGYLVGMDLLTLMTFVYKAAPNTWQAKGCKLQALYSSHSLRISPLPKAAHDVVIHIITKLATPHSSHLLASLLFRKNHIISFIELHYLIFSIGRRE